VSANCRVVVGQEAHAVKLRGGTGSSNNREGCDLPSGVTVGVDIVADVCM
jgi:L-aminopeptidase/D-esterase-like protein